MGGPAPRGDSASAISVFRHPLSRASPSTPGRGQWPRCTPAASPLVPAASSRSLPPRLSGVAGVDLPGTRAPGPPPSCSPANGIWAGSPFQLLEKVPPQTFVEEIHMDPSLGVEVWTHGDTVSPFRKHKTVPHPHHLHPHQQCGCSDSPNPCPHLLLSVFLLCTVAFRLRERNRGLGTKPSPL